MNMHASFTYVTKMQDFDIDHVIEGLKQKRDSGLAFIKRDLDSVIKAIAEDKQFYTSFYGADQVHKSHQAILDAKYLKELGIKTVRLNIEEDLATQIVKIKNEVLNNNCDPSRTGNRDRRCYLNQCSVQPHRPWS